MLSYDVINIDEYGTLSRGDIDYISICLQILSLRPVDGQINTSLIGIPFAGKQIILYGDILQL